ncbi:Zinc metalloprotease TldD [Candidatus Tiddalikarchaeum anstoanum]|nr:Zinc metalloprotease TldD [Candidatus Tiddalikarchaeum anstoanum]
MNAESLIKKFENKASIVQFNQVSNEKEALIQRNNELLSFIKSSSESYGVRMLVNGGWGLSATTIKKDIPKLFDKSYKLALNASKNIRNKTVLKELSFNKCVVKSDAKINPFLKSDEEKIKLIGDINKYYTYPEIKNVETTIIFSRGKSTTINSLGSNIKQERDFSEMVSHVVGGANLEETAMIKRGKLGFELFNMFNIESEIKKTEEKLKRLINAKNVNCGNYNIIIDPEMGGLFFHEAVGHALEADNLREKGTCLALNEKVGPDFLTLYDDPTIPHLWGSYVFDDEGIKSKPSMLIDKGVVVNFINDLSSYYDIDGLKKTANGRMDNPLAIPIPRMSNTVVEKGSMKKDELIHELKNGLLVSGSIGGAVDSLTGIFSFKAEEAFVIKEGEEIESLKGVTLSGDLKKLMKNIRHVGNEYGDGLMGGFCGKKGQRVPVSDMVPYLLVEGVSVGN